MFRNRRRDERGAMLVVTALSLVALMAFAGLVIDGGRAYSDHRQVQNSADAGALAGASALNSIINTAGADASIIRTAVQDSITANGTNGGFTCTLVDVNGSPVAGSSDCPSSPSTLPAGTAGVKVRALDNQSTSFTKVVGINAFSASGDATAQVQAVRGGTSPFMICGLPAALGGQDPPLLTQSGSDWVVNTAAVYQYPTVVTEYKIHDNNGPGSCGGGSNGFKGLVNTGQTYDMPGYWDNDTGTRAGPVRQYLAGSAACQDDLAVGCEISVPICNAGNGATGTNLKLWCVAMGSFRITHSTNTEHYGVFIGAKLVTSGQGGGIPTAGENRIIKLTE